MELSTAATEINYLTCNYGNIVSMATEIHLRRFAVANTQILYLEPVSPGETTVPGSTCCHRNLVTMATENYLCYSGI